VIIAKRASGAAPMPNSSGTNTEKPAEMPLPVSRGYAESLLQCKNAASGTAFSLFGVGPASF